MEQRKIKIKRARFRAVRIPIRIQKAEMSIRSSRHGLRTAGSLILVLFLIISQAQLFSAFESHVINITAHICNYSETRTMGYWKNHHSVYLPHLPQYLGAPGEDEIIDTQQKVNQVFLDYNLSMRNKLKGQLLAMKFNIAYFGIGGYLVESEGKTIDQIVAKADDLLRQSPEPSKEVLEVMKDLLDYLNNLHQIKYCSTSLGAEIGGLAEEESENSSSTEASTSTETTELVTGENGVLVPEVDASSTEEVLANEATTTETVAADEDMTATTTTTEETSTTDEIITEENNIPTSSEPIAESSIESIIQQEPAIVPNDNSSDGIVVADNDSNDGNSSSNAPTE